MSRVWRTRWRCLGQRVRWRAGWLRGEWWIGARYDLAADALMLGLFGLVVLVVWDEVTPPRASVDAEPDPSAGA